MHVEQNSANAEKTADLIRDCEENSDSHADVSNLFFSLCIWLKSKNVL